MTVYNDVHSEYIRDLFAREDGALQRVLADNMEKGLPSINIKPEEGRFLQFLVRASGAARVLEIGTLGGYSTIWLARGLPPGGRLITLEIDPERARLAREHFAMAGVDGRVEVRIGEARLSLQALSGEPPFDFLFIDAEKTGYNDYLDWAMEHVRLGGVIVAHNAFRKGSVTGQTPPDAYTEIMKAFNRRVAADPRLISTIYPAGDGSVLAVRVG